MFSKFRQRCFFWLIFVLFGLLISLYSNFYPIAPRSAQAVTVERANKERDVRELEKQGQHYYSIAQFDRAIEFWQQAEARYAEGADFLSRGRVLSNLALAYSQLGDWQQADINIKSSLQIVQQDNPVNSVDRVAILAQIMNGK